MFVWRAPRLFVFLGAALIIARRFVKYAGGGRAPRVRQPDRDPRRRPQGPVHALSSQTHWLFLASAVALSHFGHHPGACSASRIGHLNGFDGHRESIARGRARLALRRRLRASGHGATRIPRRASSDGLGCAGRTGCAQSGMSAARGSARDDRPGRRRSGEG